MERERGGRPPYPGILTPAERRVLEELRRGGTNAEIAVRLRLSPETVKTHIARMLSKLNLANRDELAAWQPPQEPLPGHLRGALSLSAGLASLRRPVIWAGRGLTVAVGVGVAVVTLIAMLDGEDHARRSPDGMSPITGESTPQPTSTIEPTPEATPLQTTTPQPTPYSHRWAGEEDPYVCCVFDGESDDPRFRSVLMCGISPKPVRPAHGLFLCNPLSGFLAIATAIPRREEIRWIHPPPPEYEAAIAEFEARLQMPLLDSGVHTFSGEGYSFTITVPDDERVAVAAPSTGAYIFWTWRGRLRVSATAGGTAEIIEVIGDRDRVLFDELLNSVTWVERPVGGNTQSSSD